MQEALPRNHNAFIRGRSIKDNILLVHELVRGYNMSTLSLRCASKVDLQITFDSIHWELLMNILHALNFPAAFIQWIQICITNPGYFSRCYWWTKGIF